MLRLVHIIGLTAAICSAHFLFINLFGLYFQSKGWITESQSDKWYFIASSLAYPSVLWAARELFKHFSSASKKAFAFFIVMDFMLNCALLGFLAEIATLNTGYNSFQIIAVIVSLFISIWQYRSKSKTFK